MRDPRQRVGTALRILSEQQAAGNGLATRPIGSPLDSRGVSIRNGLQGEPKLILDGRLQYIWRVRGNQAGVFLEIYNLTNHVNFGNPTGARNSVNYMVPIVTDDPRTAQLGFRFTF